MMTDYVQYFNFTVYLIVFAFVTSSAESSKPKNDLKLLVVTVATNHTDGFDRFVRSAKKFDLDVEVLGMGKMWKGGDVKNYPGGGQKVRLFQQFLNTVEKDKNAVLLFTDSYDVIINADAKSIIERFKKLNADILFSAEEFCWPDQSLKVKYPIVKSGKRYLNSGMFIGYANAIKNLLSHAKRIKDDDDDQLFYTNIYLDEKLRDSLNIKLDHVSSLLQNLNGAMEDIDLNFGSKYTSGFVDVRNFAYTTEPLIIHGNGASKVFLNYLGNYIGKAWKTGIGCVDCQKLSTKYLEMQESDLPEITLALFIEQPTPFLDNYFQIINNLAYPKTKIHIFLHNTIQYHSPVVESYIRENGSLYKSITFLKDSMQVEEREARNKALQFSIDSFSQFLFVVDSGVRLTDPLVLRKLMDTEKPIVAPMVVKRNKLFSNFWGSLADDGFYARSEDYVTIVQRDRKGIWNVPHISSVYLIQASRFSLLAGAYSMESRFDPDMSFSKSCLREGYFMYVDNRDDYGHLIHSDEYDVKLKHPEFYQLFDNQEEWEKLYLHENYSQVLDSDFKVDQPCPDVYWFPIFSELFCQHLIDIMENYGVWSSGSNKDERLSGGYENVPTRDIHLNQVGLERHWLHMLNTYFRPVQEKLFVGYYHVPPHAIMNFVVRYKPDEQPYLRPHHDASTYTVNLALNTYQVDYEGGGSHFLRYNCSVVKSRPGWAILHPGRLTHLHEGLPTTSGTRYIMVSFVDP